MPPHPKPNQASPYQASPVHAKPKPKGRVPDQFYVEAIRLLREIKAARRL